MASKVDKKKVIALVIILIAIAAIYFFSRPKDCGTDDNCFNSYAAGCSKAKVNTISSQNNYNYEVLGKKRDNCIIEVTLTKVSDTQPADMKQALEGRSMKCAIPRSTLETTPVNNIDSLNDYCTGPLKEAILQLTLDKMYDLIVKNLGPLSAEFAEQLKT